MAIHCSFLTVNLNLDECKPAFNLRVLLSFVGNTDEKIGAWAKDIHTIKTNSEVAKFSLVALH